MNRFLEDINMNGKNLLLRSFGVRKKPGSAVPRQIPLLRKQVHPTIIREERENKSP